MIGVLASLRPRRPPLPEPSTVEKIWSSIPVGARVALIALIVVTVLYFVVRGLRRIGPQGRRVVLIVSTIVSLLGLVGFTFWTSRLPEARGSYFVLSHQLVRVGGALCGTFFVLGAMSLSLPAVLDRIEGRGFVSFTAARHVRAGKSGFLTIISILSIAGVAVSAFALCAVISIMGGFGADLKRKILGNNAHIRVDTDAVGGIDYWEETLDKVRLTNGVVAATPVAGGEAMASSSSNTAGTIVRGIDPTTIGTVIELLNNIEVGKFEYLKDPIQLTRLPPDTPIGIGPGGDYYLKGPDLRPFVVDPDVEEAVKPPDAYPGLVIGRELAKTLHVYVGDEVTLVAPLGDLGPMGIMPRSRQFRIAAIFYSGMYEYDASHVYMDMEAAQEFLDLKHKVTGIEIKVEDAERVTEVTPAVREAVGRDDVRIRDWKELNKNLFSALKLEKVMTFIILSLAIAVASFCIICTLMLMVTEKSKEIAILKSIGASDNAILRVFMSEGIIIGMIGTVFGVVTGLATCLGLKWLGVRLDPDVYYVDRLPIHVDWLEYTLVALAALAITTLATVYPALAASRLRPVDGIRYE